MTQYPTEKSVKYFRLVTHAMMKASKREEEYLDIEPYFEEAMKSLPEERKELFYLNFDSRLQDIGIAKELNMQVSEVVAELRKSIIIILDKARDLYIEDHAEEIEEYRQFCDFMNHLIEDIKKGKF